MLGLVQIGTVEQAQECRVLQVVVPGQGDQFSDGDGGAILLQVERTFGVAFVAVIDLQHRAKQIVLVPKVVVQHALVDACQRRNAVHTRSVKAVLRKLGMGGRQDASATVFRVARWAGGR